MSKRTPEEIIHSVERYQRGETSQGAEAKRLGVSQQAFQDWVRKYETFIISGPCDIFLNAFGSKAKKQEKCSHLNRSGIFLLKMAIIRCDFY